MDIQDTEFGLRYLTQVVAQKTQEVDVAGNYGSSGNFENTTFAVNAYCWGCVTCDDMDQECAPNFTHKASGISIDWYKRLGRGMSLRSGTLTFPTWFEIMNDCLNSLKK